MHRAHAKAPSFLQLSPIICVLQACLFLPVLVSAGQLIIHNTSQNTITCTVDGYTTATGWRDNWLIKVDSGEKFYVAQNYNRATPVINWVDCGGGLRTRNMNITPNSLDGLVVINGQQNRVLNALLYPYLPSNPNGDFQAMLTHIINVYQAERPQVLLNLVLNPDIDIYSFTELPKLLGPGGFDVAEVDTLYLVFLAESNLITPVGITGDPPWPVGRKAVTFNDMVYGVPSWLCMDFVYGFNPKLKSVSTLPELLQLMPTDRLALVADYNGSWRAAGIYFNAYVQNYGYAALPKAYAMPPDPTVISNLADLVRTCDWQGANNCANNTYHSGPDGVTEKVFATGNAAYDMGFSEQSFYVQLYQTVPGTLSIIPSPWGSKPQPLLYTDAFVNNRATCSSGDCPADTRAFTTMMTGAEMKTYIAYSQDLPVGNPPRHLLVATQPFYQQQRVKDDPLYQQFVPVLTSGQPFPHTWSAETQQQVYEGVCKAMQQQIPGFYCKPSSNPLRYFYRR